MFIPMILAEILTPVAVVLAVVCAVLGAGGIFLYFRVTASAAKAQVAQELEAAKKEADAIRREAEVEKKEVLVQTREQARQEVEQASQKQLAALKETEERLKKRESNVDRQLDQLGKKEEGLQRSEERMRETQTKAESRQEEADRKFKEYGEALERAGRMSQDDARKEILQRVEDEMDREVAELIDRRVRRAEDEADERARKIVIQSIQRYAAPITADNTTATVAIPSDDLKGRIIGREGRNIRAFERATGVDVIVDDTPGVVVISAFDCVRRETARMALEKLIEDGRIHPARIEEIVEKTQKDMSRIITENGKKAALEMGMKVHRSLIDLLGRLRYRTSYGQNVLEHSIEVAHLCGLLASDLKLDIKLAKRCGLLHDVGKAIDQDQEGTHPQLGAEALKKANEPEEAVNAAASHHNDVPMTSLYAVVVQCADAISASRPGARRENLERYIKRMERLEEIATSYPCIESAYAIQAGRELRVISKADQAGEAECTRIAQQIAKQIEEELSYPGEIRVTLIRESRFIEYAR